MTQDQNPPRFISATEGRALLGGLTPPRFQREVTVQPDAYIGRTRGWKKETLLTGVSTIQEPAVYMEAKEAAEYLGITVQGFWRRDVPTPDALIGSKRGWTRATIDQWNAAQRKRGRYPATYGNKKPAKD